MDVAETIRAEIRRDGPIGFDRYMELALYGPGGYYEQPPVGAEGDFVTSPHVHAVFGQLLGSAVAELWDMLVRQRAWGPARFRDWQARALVAALLP